MQHRMSALIAGFLALLILVPCGDARATSRQPNPYQIMNIPPLRIGSWNVKSLGIDEDKKSYPMLASVISAFDVIALQEVMKDWSIPQIEAEVERVSGDTWSSIASPPTGRDDAQEMFLFLWRDKIVESLDSTASFPDPRDIFEHNPFSGRFITKRGDMIFTLATAHITRTSAAEAETEASALEGYWRWLEHVYGDRNIVLLGDLALPVTHEAFQPLNSHAQAMINSPSILAPEDGHYAAHGAAIWLSRKADMIVQRSGILNYPKLLAITHANAIDQVSDHAPAYMTGWPPAPE